MKSYFLRGAGNPLTIFTFFVSLIIFKIDYGNAEDLKLKDVEIDSSTKYDGKDSALPTNPFEIVEMIRRANSLNDATNPSDAIDDALKSFYIIDEKEKL